MSSADKYQLEELGLAPGEAQVYLALLRHGPMAAAGIADETGLTRTAVYPIIGSLADKGLLESSKGYGTKFAATPPDRGLPVLIARERQALAERERIAEELAVRLAPLAAESDPDAAIDDTVQIVRTPQVITQRWQRMQAEAKQCYESLTKAPILSFPNPAQDKAGKRGVRYRAVYERAVIEDPRIIPYLERWIAGGEEIRIYEGALPFKLVICDRKVVLLTLARRSGSPAAMFVRHEPFARGMGGMFDHFWEQAKPLDSKQKGNASAAGKPSSGLPFDRNGRPGRSARKGSLSDK